MSVIETASWTETSRVAVGRNPTALAITNNGDDNDADETVFVTEIFSELIPHGPGEARDLGKQGVVYGFVVGNPSAVTKITLSPLTDSGFIANRQNFCPSAHPAHVANPLLCPRSDLPANDQANTNAKQGVFPNQLLSALIRGNRLWLPNIGAQPEPPEVFNARALPTPRSGPNLGRGVSIAQPAWRRHDCGHDQHDRPAESPGLSEGHRWDQRPAAIRWRRVQGHPETAGSLSAAAALTPASAIGRQSGGRPAWLTLGLAARFASTGR